MVKAAITEDAEVLASLQVSETKSEAKNFSCSF